MAVVYSFRLLFSSSVLIFHLSAQQQTVDVHIDTGSIKATIRGKQHENSRAFLGVPFAKPPVGPLRYAPAQRSDPSGTIEALNVTPMCVQHQQTRISEDCLYMNIWTPANVTSSSNLPVYFWVHGGGLESGDDECNTQIYTQFINRGPIVMVATSYRLNSFGFFTTRDHVVPGNMGTSDQIAALQWVQKYIRFFGGNPNKVTIGGSSSGAESVSFLTLVKQTDGLFHQVVQESGSAFGAGVFSYDFSTRNSSMLLAIRLGCTTQSQWESGDSSLKYQAVQCLRTKNISEIMEADSHIPHFMKWGFVTEPTYAPQSLEAAALSRKPLPVLLGNAHDEWLAWEEGNVENHLSSFTKSKLVGDLTKSNEMLFYKNQPAVTNAALEAYVNALNFSENDNVNWARTYIQLYSDMEFIGPVLRDARFWAFTGSRVYLYSFDFMNSEGLPGIKDPALRLVPHTWDKQYTFNYTRYTSADDKATVELMGRLWINFVTTGNPTPSSGGQSVGWTWPEVGDTNRFVSLGPKPLISQNFHPSSRFFACTAPSMDGHTAPFCS